jgi:hypothetical protein
MTVGHEEPVTVVRVHLDPPLLLMLPAAGGPPARRPEMTSAAERACNDEAPGIAARPVWADAGGD